MREFKLKPDIAEELLVYSELLKKDPSDILNDALKLYFENEQKRLLEKNINDESAMTNLDFDEFWGGVEI